MQFSQVNGLCKQLFHWMHGECRQHLKTNALIQKDERVSKSFAKSNASQRNAHLYQARLPSKHRYTMTKLAMHLTSHQKTHHKKPSCGQVNVKRLHPHYQLYDSLYLCLQGRESLGLQLTLFPWSLSAPMLSRELRSRAFQLRACP